MNRVPKLRFPEFSGEWEEKRIEKILTIGSGKDYKHLGEGDIPVFGTGGYMTSVDHFLYEGETVFIGRKGTINKPFYFNGKFWTVDTLFYTYKFENSFPKFVYALFQKIDWLQYNEASGVPSLSKTTINDISISIPTLPEQQEIASFLSSVDSKIEKLERKKELWEQYKKGMMQKIFSQELRFKDENGEDYPEWEEKQIKEVGKFYRGVSYKPEDLYETDTEDSIRLLRSNNIKDNTLNNDDLQFVKKYKVKEVQYLKKGDIAICMANGSKQLVGKNGIFKFNDNFRYTVGAFCSIFSPSKNINSRFVGYLFQSSIYYEFIKTLFAGTNINNLKNSDLEEMFFQAPSLTEQTQIANFLSSIDSKIDIVGKELDGMKEFKKGLLQQMFA